MFAWYKSLLQLAIFSEFNFRYAAHVEGVHGSVRQAEVEGGLSARGMGASLSSEIDS